MSINHRLSTQLQNDQVYLTLLPGGGHIAELVLKSNAVNPLWIPPWQTIEPADYDPQKHPEYGPAPEAGLLAGISGHNLCFDFFGPPTAAEAAAGQTVHGEASTVNYEVEQKRGELRAVATLPKAEMRIERVLRLAPDAQAIVVTETAENLTGVDRPVGWTQHATLGPPFLAKGKTVMHMPATASKVLEEEFAEGNDRFAIGAEFQWPMAPLARGGYSDLRVTVDTPFSGAFTTHLMSPSLKQAYFTAFNPDLKTVFGYIWKRDDFPWVGIWEENYNRKHAPWNGKTFTRGMEFGASPMPEPRDKMVDRGTLFGERCYRWIGARSKVTVEYCLFIAESDKPIEAVVWAGDLIRGDDGFEVRV